jgi:hypothetical protein
VNFSFCFASVLVVASSWSDAGASGNEWLKIVGPSTDLPSVRSDFELNLGGVLLRIPFDVWYFSRLNSSCVQMNSDMTEILVGDVLFRRYVVLFDLTLPHQVMLGFGLRNLSYALGSSHAVVSKHPIAKISKDGSDVPPAYAGPPIASDTVSILNKRNTQYDRALLFVVIIPLLATCAPAHAIKRNGFPDTLSTFPSARPPNPSESFSTPDPPFSAYSVSATPQPPAALLRASARLE